MAEAVIFIAALLILAMGVLAALYLIVRDSTPRVQRQYYRRHRSWNFK
jgi:hypothetical protein